MSLPGRAFGDVLDDNLGNYIGTDFAPYAKARFSDTSFTNASERYVSYKEGVTGSFAGGTLATRVIYGRTYAQIEAARTNLVIGSQDVSTWPTARASWGGTLSLAYGLSGHKLIEDNTPAQSHYSTKSVDTDGSSQYCWSIYAHADERNWIRLWVHDVGFVGYPTVYFNLATGETGTANGSPDDYGIIDLGGGWYRCWITATSDAVGTSPFTFNLADADNSPTYDGDGTSGAYFAFPQVEIGAFPSSPILTAGVSATRDKDQLYWASASVPAKLRGKISFDWIPFFDHDNSPSNYSLWDFEAGGGGDRVQSWYDGGTDEIKVYNASLGTNAVVSNVLTFNAYQKMTITVDPSAGSITVSGATSGNGTVIGTPWTTVSGDVDWGMTQSATYQTDGLISEPY